jgi:hypothetical protein
VLGPAGGVASQQLVGHCPYPRVVGFNDLRICAGGMRELDNTKNPVSQDDY